MLLWLVNLVLLVICVLLSIAFVTLLERKILGYAQNRVGPNKVFLGGWVQPILDGVKLFLKERVLVGGSNILGFCIVPRFTFILIVVIWMSQSYFYFWINFKLRGVFLICCIGVSVYTTLLSGWFSNSKYSLLGGLRAAAQSISYEVRIVFILISAFFLMERFSLWSNRKIRGWLFLVLSPSFVCWLISCLAECNRAPFDFAEGESELVSGFNVEYGSILFTFIFLGEYGIILVFSILSVWIWVGGSKILFMVVRLFFIQYIFYIRRAYPRFRYDKLIRLAWFKILPISLGGFIFSYFLTILIF